jgi:hypothetical protein
MVIDSLVVSDPAPPATVPLVETERNERAATEGSSDAAPTGGAVRVDA